MKEKVLVFWSGGKKAALALNFLVNNPEFEIVGLLSVFDRETNRIPLHGIPDSLIIEQAKLLKPRDEEYEFQNRERHSFFEHHDS